MSERAVRAVLRLHPAAYRREWGDEIAMVFADTTADAGLWATARELFDLAGQGVRRRLGLTSSSLLARLAAMVAPFAAVAAAGPGLLAVYALVRGWLHGYSGLPIFGARGDWIYYFWLGWAANLLFLTAAVAALGARWTLARAVAPLAVLLLIAQELKLWLPFVLEHPTATIRESVFLVVSLGPPTLWVLTLLAAPRDLLGPMTRRHGWAGFAGALIGVLWNGVVFYGPIRTLHSVDGTTFALLLAVAELVLLLVAVPALLRGRYGPAAAALAGLPIGSVVLLGAVHYLWMASRVAMWVVIGVVAVSAVALSRWRPTVPDRRPPAAG